MEKMMDVSNKILSNLTVYMKYARFIPELNRRETWEELVTRNKEMHKKKYPQLASEIEEVYKMVYDKKVLPSMRSLQFGGKPIEISPNRIYNCFSRETKFITSIGMQSFEDFSDGDSVVVLTHTGKWKNAIVKRYGKQNLNKIVFHRGRSEKVVFATENHRWLLYDGSETTNLTVGDILTPPPKINTFDYDSATPLERLYWCYGYVYGDGTICRDRDGKPQWSMVRLCGADKGKYLYRFEEMGFKTSSSASLNGDVMVYTGNYLKDSPDLTNDDVALIRAFVDGYLTADAYKNPDWYSNNALCKYKSILSSNVDHINFLDNALCLAGYYVTRTKDLTGYTTNFGTRPYTKSFSITNSIGSRTNTSWSVYSIEDAGRYEDVWCLEVEDDHSFILDGGIVTGNCAYLPVDDWRAFGEIMFLLLGGTGVGYSVQKHHIEKLPPIHKPKMDKERRYLVSDSIEGWADAVKALLKSYFVSGSSLRFDYSDIRPKGARLITSGGKAPGPEPLRICIEKIRSLLDTKTDGEQLKPIEVHDIVCHIADAVLAGGIRRAALISLFSADDDEMISCKFGDWWELNPQRGRANNSAVLLRSKVTEEFFKNLWKKIEYSNAGEPGIYLSNDKDWGTNPSLRAGTKVLTTDGIFPIEQLDGKEFFVKNLNGEISKAKCWLSGKNKQLYKITLTGNHTYYATPEHEWPVWNGEEYVKVRSEDLSAGNILPIIRESSLFDGSLGNYKDGFFIGWHLGDGWTSIRKDGDIVHGMVVSHTESEYVKDKLEEYLSTELKSSAKFSFRDNGTFELNTTLNSWNYLQEKFGYHKKESGLPVAVWERGSEEFRKGIIDGLFSSDGHVSNNRITLTTKHEKLANDVSELLGFYGIKTVISKSNSILNENVYTRFDVEIKEKHSILHFRNVFKLTNSKKQEVLDSIEYKYSIPDLKQIEIIDVELSEVVEDVWDISVYDETHCFQIAHAITGNCCEIALRPFQFCVAGDTKLITRAGITTIEESVDTDIEIWNGEAWSLVRPYQTGTADRLHRVWFNDGSYLDATDNHKFLVKTRFEDEFREVDTLELIELLKTTKYGLQIPRANVIYDDGTSEPNAYDYGFILGDGFVYSKKTNGAYRYVEANLFNDDKFLEFETARRVGEYVNYNGTKYTTIRFDVDSEFAYSMKYADGLPSEVFSWDKSSILKFIAGWADADGSNTSNGIRIWGREDKLRDAQLLLTKVGINCSLNLSSDAGSSTNLGTRRKALWYLQITRTSEIPCQRLICNNNDDARHKGKYQLIKSVETLDGLHRSFCLTEDSLHQCVFNNVLTKQCNLCEVNVSDVETQEELEARVKAATFIGTLQAGYTDFHYLRPVWQRTTEKDALLGVGMTGIGSGRVMKLDVKAAAKVAKEENERVADILGIGRAARITTIKPAGTSSLTLGCSSGIHAWHNNYYLRRIRVGKNEAIYHHLAVNHPELVEDDYFRPHDTAIIGVPQKAPDGSILRTESPLQLLERVKWFSQNWIKPGHRNGMNTHNISATVSIRDHEWDAVGTWLWDNREFYNGISVLPYDDHSYVQSPFEDIAEERYHELMKTLVDVDLSKVIEFDDNTDLAGEIACSGNACEIR